MHFQGCHTFVQRDTTKQGQVCLNCGGASVSSTGHRGGSLNSELFALKNCNAPQKELAAPLALQHREVQTGAGVLGRVPKHCWGLSPDPGASVAPGRIE